MLRGKDLIAVREGLEFDAVARWVLDEHGPLLSWFALKSDGGRYEKRYSMSGYPLTKGPPCFGVQHRPEMTQRDIDSVNFRCHCWFDDGRDVRRDLIAKEVNVDPMVRLAANATPQNISVEHPCRLNISDRKREVEGARHAYSHSMVPGGFDVMS